MNWYGKMYKERLEDQLNTGGTNPKGWEWTATDPMDKASIYGFKIEGRNAETKEQFRIIVQNYSACCAFHQLNYFTYAINSKDLVEKLMDHCLVSLREGYSRDFGRKLVLNTVQSNKYNHDKSNMKLKVRECGEDGHVYPEIIAWARKQKGGCIDTVIVNQNTHNIIHHLIVAPDVCNYLSNL